ncbi:MAG: hypothetical protein M1829_001318 [Trizodia sp. TS-e1964]|nr:MAG: hypothetical protein M1829_001318 [Trizodia sp. TS-e1964]
MSTPGYVFKDSGTTPPAIDNPSDFFVQARPEIPTQLEESLTIPDQATSRDGRLPPINGDGSFAAHSSLLGRAQATIEESTDSLKKNFVADSHELAAQYPEFKGVVHTEGTRLSHAEVKDLGWHKPNVEIPGPLLGDISNGRLWALVRRFNKDVIDVRAVSIPVASGLDLNEAWSDEHAADKMTLNLQRVYLSIVLGVASLFKQVSRLRSWKETWRTASFCVVYFTAWILDLLIPLVLGTLISILASESARNALFPPAPRALVNLKTGGLQKPQAGQLGTNDTLTGAPEKHEGEAAEEEAANFATNLRHLALRALGMHAQQGRDGDPLEGKIPKPMRSALKAVQAQGSTAGHATEDSDPTQKPMEEILWSIARPENLAPIIKAAPHALGEVVDIWERCANAISPTSPFSRFSFIRMDGVLLPLFLGSFLVDYYMVYKGLGFAIGFAIFGDPILTPSLKWLNRNYPNWMELLEPKNNILRGVPTNNQLTLTLLRIGEAYNTPLPPGPTSKPEEPNQLNQIDAKDVPLGASEMEVVNAIEPSLTEKARPDGEAGSIGPTGSKHKHLSNILRVFKGSTKAAVKTKLAVDHAKAAVGSEKAKGHLGVLSKQKDLIYAGPSKFKGRFDGKEGWVLIDDSVEPHLLFTADDPPQYGSSRDFSPASKIKIGDIKRLKRATAFSSMPGEMIAEWSTSKELLGGIEINDRFDKCWRFTALPERDELFNRLVAISSQKWENV